MENLFKWSSIAFGLSDHGSSLKIELELAQKKISEINTALGKARVHLVEMFERDDVTCEELALQERQLLVLGKLFMKKRVDLIRKIVSACLEGVRSFAHKIDSEDVDKIKLMAKAIKYINKEKELPKASSELYTSLYQEILSVFQHLRMLKRKSTLSVLDTLNLPELEQNAN